MCWLLAQFLVLDLVPGGGAGEDVALAEGDVEVLANSKKRKGQASVF